jgi:REP element-mobilizing transposase RayT
MTNVAPLYTPANCRVAFQLNWSVTFFGHQELPPSEHWIGALKEGSEGDGIRILEYSAPHPKTIQFLVSTRPPTAPSDILRLLKGRLQFAIRDQQPSAFRRNYRIQSVGSANDDVVDRYLGGQLRRQGMADSNVQARLAQYQIMHNIDLSRVRYTAHGQFIYSLHLVLVHADRGSDDSRQALATTRAMILKAGAKHQLEIGRGSLLADHLHLSVGCPITLAPEDIVLVLMNNVAFAHGMIPWFDFGYYVGTFGPYDLGAIRNALQRRSASHRDKPGGEESDGGKMQGTGR